MPFFGSCLQICSLMTAVFQEASQRHGICLYPLRRLWVVSWLPWDPNNDISIETT